MTSIAFTPRGGVFVTSRPKWSPRRADPGAGAPRRGATAKRRGRVSGASERLRRERATSATWELRSFVGSAAAIAVAFVLALAYLAGSTGVASVGYEAQRLQGQRDELRRQNALLELELARLDSPARIEAAARRLGLVRVAYIPVVPADPLTARR